MVPGRTGVNVRFTLALPPFVRAPKEQMIAPPMLLNVPCEGAAETKVALAGMGFVRVTPVAVAGPKFMAASVKVMLLPTTTGSGEWEMLKATSTDAFGMQQVDSRVVTFKVHPPAR